MPWQWNNISEVNLIFDKKIEWFSLHQQAKRKPNSDQMQMTLGFPKFSVLNQE